MKEKNREREKVRQPWASRTPFVSFQIQRGFGTRFGPILHLRIIIQTPGVVARARVPAAPIKYNDLAWVCYDPWNCRVFNIKPWISQKDSKNYSVLKKTPKAFKGGLRKQPSSSPPK